MLAIKFGKFADFFNCNIGEENLNKFYDLLKKTKNKVIHRDSRYYYWNDLKLIISSTGTQKCQKKKINHVKIYKSDNYDVRFEYYEEYILPLDIFPPITQYHDIKGINQSVFLNNKNIEYQINNFTHLDEENTYEFTIIVDKSANVDKILSDLGIKNLKLISEKRIIHHNPRLSISVCD